MKSQRKEGDEREETDDSSGEDDVNDSASPIGFGFIPKYEKPAAKSQKKSRNKKTIQTDVINDVGIWSDEEANEQKLVTAHLRTVTSNSDVPETFENHKLSQNDVKSTNRASTDREIANHDSEKQSYDYDHESDDNESLVHEPVSATKKTFVFNIKLPKQEAEIEEVQTNVPPETKTKDDTKDKNEINFCSDQITTTISSILPDNVVTSTKVDDNVTILTTSSDTIMSYQVDSQVSDEARMVQSYNPYMMHSHFMGPRAMMSHPLYYQFMNYPIRQPFSQIDFAAPLPEQDQPPLPGDGKLNRH